MSQTISKVKYFLLYLLHDEKRCAFKTLYHCVGENEARALSEICMNILHGELKVDKQYIKKYKRILLQLSKADVHHQSKERYIKIKYKEIYMILQGIKDTIVALL
jgi:hypothetical protein